MKTFDLTGTIAAIICLAGIVYVAYIVGVAISEPWLQVARTIAEASK